MNSISFNPNVSSVQSFSGVKEVKNADKISEVDVNAEVNDKVELKNKKEGELTKAEKQKIISKSRITASGWSAFGGLISTLYFGLRSKDTIAEVYKLDEKKDAEFISKIRKQQVLATLPAVAGHALFGVGHIVGGGIAWIYHSNADPSNIDV